MPCYLGLSARRLRPISNARLGNACHTPSIGHSTTSPWGNIDPTANKHRSQFLLANYEIVLENLEQGGSLKSKMLDLNVPDHLEIGTM